MISRSFSVTPNNKLVESKTNGCGQSAKFLREPSTSSDYFLMGTRGTNTRNGDAADCAEAAQEAGLQYVSDERSGYSRTAKGKDFQYLDTEGKKIRDEQRLLRIKRLAIPPAW